MSFKHSVKVPTQYKITAVVLRTALKNRQKSLKTLINEQKHANVKRLYKVVKLYLENRGAIDAAIEQTKILEDNPLLEPVLCKVLIIESIFMKAALIGDSKPVQTVRAYKDRLEEALSIAINSHDTETKDIRPCYVRINTNLLSVEQAHKMLAKENFRKKENIFKKYEDFLKAVQDLTEDEYMLDMHVDNLLIFHPNKMIFLSNHKFVTRKKFIIQNKGTCLVVKLLQPSVGSTVLDMCAAPGMKTVHTCNVLQNKGTIYAIDKSAERYSLLCSRIKDTGCKIVYPIMADAFTVTAEQCPGVEYIIVDPTCSDSGLQNHLSLEPEEKSPERIRNLANFQIKLLSYAMSAFPDVKRIAYSTNSLYQEENEEVVKECLQLNPCFRLLNGKNALCNKWRSVGSSKFKDIGEKCIYSRPNEDMTKGGFIAIFEKCGSSGEIST